MAADRRVQVTMQLRNTLLHTRYPTVTLASKIEAAMWPSKRLVAKRVEKSLQKLLADEKSEELRQEVAPQVRGGGEGE